MSEEEKIREEYMKLRQRKEIESGGDSTLNIKNFTKSLKDLAGGDDSIFAIIDDRSDVWQQEVKNADGQVIETIQSSNLVMIPGYFYWNQTKEQPKASYVQHISHVAKDYDIDLSLILHLKFLDRVHADFYSKHDQGLKADIKHSIKDCKK